MLKLHSGVNLKSCDRKEDKHPWVDDVLDVHGTQCMLYSVYLVLIVCCTQCMLCLVYAVLNVNSRLWHGEIVWDDRTYCPADDSGVMHEKERWGMTMETLWMI
jgi:hypothetical protein